MQRSWTLVRSPRPSRTAGAGASGHSAIAARPTPRRIRPSGGPRVPSSEAHSNGRLGLRAMAFAALGAAEVLAVHPEHEQARGCSSSMTATDRSTRNFGRSVAMARAPTELRQRCAGRSPHRRRRCLGRPPGPRRRSRLAGLAARPRNGRRPPLADTGRRRWSWRSRAQRSINSRSKSPPWPTPVAGPTRRHGR